MKTLLFVAAFAVAVFSGGYVIATAPANHTHETVTEIVEHGGGCRKSSPQGMCCHMDHKTKTVHCH